MKPSLPGPCGDRATTTSMAGLANDTRSASLQACWGSMTPNGCAQTKFRFTPPDIIAAPAPAEWPTCAMRERSSAPCNSGFCACSVSHARTRSTSWGRSQLIFRPHWMPACTPTAAQSAS